MLTLFHKELTLSFSHQCHTIVILLTITEVLLEGKMRARPNREQLETVSLAGSPSTDSKNPEQLLVYKQELGKRRSLI